MKKIVIAGGSGFLGKSLMTYLPKEKYQFTVLTRGETKEKEGIQYIHWDTHSLGSWTKALEGADILINMAGKSVNCRYTPENKAEIYRSRKATTRLLGEAINKSQNPPSVWINSSTATIYRHETQRANTETNGVLGEGFSVDVAKQWEKTFDEVKVESTRKIILRTAIVLGEYGDAFHIYKGQIQKGLNGRHASGKQMVSWLHAKDFARIIDFLIERPVQGIYNAVSPNAVPNHEFMQIFKKVLKVDWGICLPKWMLTVGAYILGTDTEMVLKSRWVYPERFLKEGFSFKYPKLKEALEEIVNNE